MFKIAARPSAQSLAQRHGDVRRRAVAGRDQSTHWHEAVDHPAVVDVVDLHTGLGEASRVGRALVAQRIVAWGDGWLPNRITPDELRTSRVALDRMAKDAGRDPSKLTISVHGQPADRDLIRRLLDAGATRVIVRPPVVKTESEMGTELSRIADAVLR